MIILTLRTDKPEAEIGLFDVKNQLSNDTWQAHRKLAETIHARLAKNLKTIHKDWSDIKAIIVYKGPGSFTGLRIGLSLANALAASLQIPIVGTSGLDWQSSGLALIMQGEDHKLIMPEYGAPVHTTAPKK